MTCGHGRKRGMTCAQLIALRDKVEQPPLTQFKSVNYGGRLMYKKSPALARLCRIPCDDQFFNNHVES